MPNIVSSINIRAVNSLADAGRKMTRSVRELTTGMIGPEKVNENIAGSKCKTSATLLRTYLSQTDGAKNIISITQSKLTSMKDAITEARNTLAQQTTDAATLASYNDTFQRQVGMIFQDLANTNYNGAYLFHGFTAAAGAVTGDEGLPVNGQAPLQIRVGDAIGNTVPVSIPKLISGKLNGNVASINNIFTPLFPATGTVLVPGTFGTIGNQIITSLAPLAGAAPNQTGGAEDPLVTQVRATLGAAAIPPAAAIPATNTYKNVANILFQSPTMISNLVDAMTRNLAAGSPGPDDLGGIVATKNIIKNNINAILSNAAVNIQTLVADTTGANQAARDDLNRANIESILAGSVNSFLSVGNMLSPTAKNQADATLAAAADTIDRTLVTIGNQLNLINRGVKSMSDLATIYDITATDILSVSLEEASAAFADSYRQQYNSIYAMIRGQKVDELFQRLIAAA